MRELLVFVAVGPGAHGPDRVWLSAKRLLVAAECSDGLTFASQPSDAQAGCTDVEVTGTQPSRVAGKHSR